MTTLPKITNVDIKEPKGARLAEKITARQIYRQKEDLAKWSTAISEAEDVYRPDRLDLVRIFKSIKQDAHLRSAIDTLRFKILKSKFAIHNEDGEINDELTARFQKKWFKDWIGLVLDQYFEGFALAQFGPVKNDVFEYVKKVNPENVLPDINAFRPDAYVWDVQIPLNGLPVADWTILLFDAGDLGVLNDAVPLVLWKRNAINAWSDAADIFGMPLRVGKTDITDPSQKQNMYAFLENLGKAAFAVIGPDDEIEFIEASRQDFFKVYDMLIERMNSELSKLILGQTMTSDNGSSRSQATVHEGIFDDRESYHKGRVVEQTEDKLFPLMRAKGMLPEGVYLRFDESEKMELKDRGALLVDLLNTGKFNVDPQFISENFDIEVEEKEEIAPERINTGTRKAIDNLLKRFDAK